MKVCCQHFGVGLFLAHRLRRSLGVFVDHRNFLASSPCILGGNFSAGNGSGMLRQCGEEPDLSLHSYRTTFFDRRNPVSLVGPHAPQPRCNLDSCRRGNGNRLPAGVALHPTLVHSTFTLKIQISTRQEKRRRESPQPLHMLGTSADVCCGIRLEIKLNPERSWSIQQRRRSNCGV
jgi:hypothetical protein